jgi:hypothetical protein
MAATIEEAERESAKVTSIPVRVHARYLLTTRRLRELATLFGNQASVAEAIAAAQGKAQEQR